MTGANSRGNGEIRGPRGVRKCGHSQHSSARQLHHAQSTAAVASEHGKLHVSSDDRVATTTAPGRVVAKRQHV
jgi:hypothetical protein